jgi:cytochrome P450
MLDRRYAESPPTVSEESESMSESQPYEHLPTLDVFSEEYARDPYPLISAARAQGPVAHSQRGLEFLDHDTCQRVLMDRRASSGLAGLLRRQGITNGPLYDMFVDGLLGAEGDLHRRLRGALMPYFNAGAVAKLRDFSRAVLRRWLAEEADSGECDFAWVIGRRLPSSLFCHMIGAPLDDAEFVAQVSEGILKVFTFEPGVGEVAERALQDAHGYLSEIVAHRREHPGDDMISALTASDGVSDVEILDLAITVLGGSTDNTNAQMCLNLMALAEHPDAWWSLKQDRSLVSAAVLEGARWKPGVLSGFRVPDEEIEAAGLTLPPGVMVNTNVLAANRDPAVYDDPDRFDLHRKVVPGLNFGHGRHFCLGRAISLVEMEEALDAVLDLWAEFDIGSTEIWGSPFSTRTEHVQVRFEAAGSVVASH